MHRTLRTVFALLLLTPILATDLCAQVTGFIKLDDGPAAPGEVIVYRFEPNEPIISTVQLTFTEAVPAHTTFEAAASDPIWEAAGCPDGATAGTVCAVTLIVGSGGGIPRFAVRVESPLTAGVDAITNTVTVEAASGTFTASRETPVDAAPELGVMKDDEGTSAVPGGTIRYRLAFTNDGTQDATGVMLEETVPEHTVLSAAGSSSGERRHGNRWGCDHGNRWWSATGSA